MSFDMRDRSEEGEWKRALLVVTVVAGLVAALVLLASRIDEYRVPREFEQLMIREGRLEFMTLGPCVKDNYSNIDLGVETIADYPIVDSRVIEDDSVIREMLEGIVPKEGTPLDEVSQCAIMPRHAVRSLESPEKYLLICFQCGQLGYFDERHRVVAMGASRGGSTGREVYVKELVDRIGMTRPPRWCEELPQVLGLDLSG
jgi:hypothetical protein